jgi:hypothetical protein
MSVASAAIESVDEIFSLLHGEGLGGSQSFAFESDQSAHYDFFHFISSHLLGLTFFF